jgi:flagellar biogenesis protein FliO
MKSRFKLFQQMAVVACVFASVAVALPSEAKALTILKQVQVANGSEISLLFDGKIDKKQIRTEFFNDIIQLNLTDVSVYPAKISSVGGAALTKIFAYQYAPKLVRCRLSVKGKADDFKNRLVVTPNGKILTIRIDSGGKSDQIASSAAAAKVDPKADKQDVKSDDAQDKALLDKVMSSKAAPAPTKEVATAEAPATAAKAEREATREREQSHEHEQAAIHEHSLGLASGKGVPSPMGAFIKLILVVGIFGLVAMGLKKALAEGGRVNNSKLFGAINRFAEKSGLSQKGKMIEVVSTHHLGPKKSIAVVRVAGRMLVLGISAESINLITRIENSGVESEEMDAIDEVPRMSSGAGAVSAGPAIFSELLNLEATKPGGPAPAARASTQHPMSWAAQQAYAQPQAQAQAQAQAQTQAQTQAQAPTITSNSAIGGYGQKMAGASVRAQIRNRLEGLKPL